LLALTRVPGIGSQSDLEARQAQLALPDLSFGPEVNARSYEELKSFISDLRAAYESVLSGNQPTQSAPAAEAPAPAASGWKITKVK
jgi:hypothetical protein